MNTAELFYTFAVPTVMLILLAAGALVVEVVAPGSRRWLRRLRRIESGRRAMARDGR